MGIYLFESALAAYFASAVIAVTEFFRESKATNRLMLVFAGAGLLLHTANVIVRYVGEGHLPVTSLHEAASFFVWCIVALFFVLEYRYKLGLLGSFILPLVFLLMLVAAFLPRQINEALPPVLQSGWLGIHTLFAFMGDAAFAMAAGIGGMYLLQERFVKSKHLGGLFHRLPSLQILDHLNYRLISIGFPLLTVAIITGVFWAEGAWGTYWRWDPKEVWSLITWLIYALILHVRLNSGWRGRKAALLSVLGFCAVIFTFFGVNLIIENTHSEFIK